MVGDENAYILVLKLIDYRLDILDGNRVDAGERFVEHNETRIDSETAGDLGSASFAAGKLVAEVLAYFLETEFGNKTLELVALLLLAHLRHLQYGPDIVLDTEFTEDGGFLSKIADAVLSTFIYRIFGDIQIVQKYILYG